MEIAKLLKSFRYALEGLKYVVITQQNMRIHFLAALGVLLFSLCLPLSKLELFMLFISITLVLFAELINTSIETIVDMVTEEFHPLAKIAKDVAAGAVFLTASLAIIVGASIFFPYLHLLHGRLSAHSIYPASYGITAIVIFDFFLTFLVKAWFTKRSPKWEPSLMLSLAGCVATLIILVIWQISITLLVLFLTGVTIYSRVQQTSNLPSLFFGGAIGVFVAVFGLQLL